MQIIVTTFLDELYELLAQVPKLATMYEMKDILYISSLKTWLEKSEVVLEKNRRPQIGEIAGIRLLYSPLRKEFMTKIK